MAKFIASGIRASNCGLDGIHIGPNAEVHLHDAEVWNVERHGIYVAGATPTIQGIRQQLQLPDAISDDEIREAAQLSAKVQDPYRVELLQQRTIGKWAKENGWQITHLAAALAQLGVAILGK